MDTKYTILFVDDEERVLRSLKSLFRRDYKVLTASNGFDALRMLSMYSVDVIISDQRMPNMLGNELLAEAKRLFPNTMRLLLTGYMDKEAIVKTINEGEVYRFISKPWQVSDIKKTVAEAAKASTILIEPVDGSDADISAALNTEDPARSQSALAERKKTNTFLQPIESLPGFIKEASANYASPKPTRAASLKKALLQRIGRKPVTKPANRIRSRNSCSVLLMDPDQNIRNQVRRLSLEQGFKVYGFQMLEQAIRALALRPNIGVAIIGLPIDSEKTIEAINLLKQHRPELSIITLTDVTDASVAVRLINMGQVFRYLEKPLQNSAFDDVISSAMQRNKYIDYNTRARERFKVEHLSNPSSNFERFKSFFKVQVA